MHSTKKPLKLAAGSIPESGLTLPHGQILELQTWEREEGFLYRARVIDPDDERLIVSFTIQAGELDVLRTAVDALKKHHRHARRACSSIAEAWEGQEG